jgi:hypothetical protein
LLISSGDPPGTPDHGFNGVSTLGLAPISHLVAGAPPIAEDFTPTAGQVGSYAYACSRESCGSGHGNMLGIITVSN